MKVFICLLIFFFTNTASSEAVWKIYIDADYSNNHKSSFSIELGLRTALLKHNNMIAGRKAVVIPLDHRANSRRSLRNLKNALKDPEALCVFSGLHSPPVLANKSFINKNKIPFLIPWAAAGPLTRSKQDFNAIFRLSIDDSKAGKFMAEYGQKQGFKNPLLILEDTGWGKSNFKTISKHLKSQNKKAVATERFKWGISQETWQIKLRELIKKGPVDHIIFVGNSRDGHTMMKALIHNKADLPILSHWGITGSDFVDKLGLDNLKELKLNFIQSNYQLNSAETQAAIKLAKTLAPDFIQDHYIPSPTGFIHSYDLSQILIAAAQNIPANSKAKDAQLTLIKSLENLTDPVQGLIKTYSRPFTPYSTDFPDAHEALGYENFRMAYYTNKGQIALKP